jgi:cytochrome c oxidase assembly protein subunit 15
LPLGLVGAQVLLGIATVLTSTSILPDNWGVFEWMAQLHQVVALLYLLAMVWMLYLARGRRLSGISNQLSAKKKAVV